MDENEDEEDLKMGRGCISAFFVYWQPDFAVKEKICVHRRNLR